MVHRRGAAPHGAQQTSIGQRTSALDYGYVNELCYAQLRRHCSQRSLLSMVAAAREIRHECAAEPDGWKGAPGVPGAGVPLVGARVTCTPRQHARQNLLQMLSAHVTLTCLIIRMSCCVGKP